MPDENQPTNPAPPAPGSAPVDPAPNLAPNPAPPAAPPTVPVSPAVGGTADPIAVTPLSAAQGNTSGQGSSAVVPEEVKGWSWGGFWLTWIWGIGNSVLLALLAFVPFVGWVMPFVLGIKGREWAWQAKHWDSVEQFNKTQKTWGMVGLILAIIGIVFTILWFLLIGVAIFNAGTSSTIVTY